MLNHIIKRIARLFRVSSPTTELLEQGCHEEVITQFDQAIRLDPQHATAYLNRGVAYYDFGQPKRAIEDFDKAIRLDPQAADAYNDRGNAYLDLGQSERPIGGSVARQLPRKLRKR